MALADIAKFKKIVFTETSVKDLEKKFPDKFKFYQKKFSELDTISKENVDGMCYGD